MSFSEDAAVTRVGPGSFTADLHERWSSLVGIHGGYTAAIVANAITAAVDDPSRALRSFATQFAAVPGPLSDEGFAVEDATMWAPDGRVLAVARQTRLAGA